MWKPKTDADADADAVADADADANDWVTTLALLDFFRRAKKGILQSKFNTELRVLAFKVNQ